MVPVSWQSACRWLNKPGSRLPLLSARPAVTFPAKEHYSSLASTKLYCLVTEAHTCMQLAWPLEPVTCESQVWCPINTATKSSNISSDWYICCVWIQMTTLSVERHAYTDADCQQINFTTQECCWRCPVGWIDSKLQQVSWLHKAIVKTSHCSY